MCGRYFCYDETAYEAEDELGFGRGTISTGSGDITPGMATPGIICSKTDDKALSVSELLWGIMSRDKKLIINARAESVSEISMFSDCIRNRRCILPATGFYEWDKDKTKFRFTRADAKPVYLAGFYDMNRNRDCFVILTTAANRSMEPVHDRMPVMIDKSRIRDYLKDPLAALDMIKEPMPELTGSSDYQQLSLQFIK